MSGIQLLLISAVTFIALYFFVRLRNRIADVLLLMCLAVTAILFVLFPEWTNAIAHTLHVGRGADLVFYLFIVLFSFVVLKLYARLRLLEQQFTELVRSRAIEEAQKTDATT